MSDLAKVIYFDIICEFGIFVNQGGYNPCECPGMPYRIPVHVQGHGRATAYGATLEEACKRALEFLAERSERWRDNQALIGKEP